MARKVAPVKCRAKAFNERLTYQESKQISARQAREKGSECRKLVLGLKKLF